MKHTRITITLSNSLMDAISRYAPADHSDSGKVRFMLAAALRHFGEMEAEAIQHGGKRPGAGRKRKQT